jgi:NTE family protein
VVARAAIQDPGGAGSLPDTPGQQPRRRHRPYRISFPGVLSGQDAARSQLAEAHLAGAQDVLAAWVESLACSSTVSNLALVQTQQHLLQVKDTIQQHDGQFDGLRTDLDSVIAVTSSRLADLESRVAALESSRGLERITNAWWAGETYQRMPWLLAVSLLCCDAADRVIAPVESVAGRQADVRRDLVNRLCIALRAERRPWFPLAVLLRDTAAAIREEDHNLVLALADDMSPLGRHRRQFPYLFTVWSAAVTAVRGDAGLDAGIAAITRCREIVGQIAMTTDLRWLITNLVDEAADSAVAVQAQLIRRMNSIPGAIAPGRSSDAPPTFTVPTDLRTPSGELPGPSFRRTVTRPRFGLVLSGGGARGAYEVGVLEYLADTGLEPDILAGASIGALNGAVISAAGSIADGVANLRAAWEEICANPNPMTGSQEGPQPGEAAPPDASLADRLAALAASARNPVLRNLDDVVRRWAPLPELRRGTELWVTVFAATQGGPAGLGWLIDVVTGSLGGHADWQCVQHAGEEAHDLVLASAAIPGIFQPRTVYSLPFRDGGLGNNIPAEPLAERGCRYALVVHLSQRGLFDSNQFKELSILEIRPRRPLATDGALGSLESLLDFNPQNFDLRRRQGYDDARYWIGRAARTNQTVREHFSSLELLTATTAQLGPLT